MDNKKKLKVILSVLIPLIVIVVTIIIVLLSLKSCKKPPENIANLSVKTTIVSNTYEDDWINNSFTFNVNDVSKQTNTTPGKRALEVNEFVRQDYVIENLTDHTINFSIRLEASELVNYKLTYKIGDGEEYDYLNNLDGYVETKETLTVSILIRIDNLEIPATFDANFYFTLNM